MTVTVPGAPATLLCLMVLSGCANPLPFGPGRAEIALEKVAVEHAKRGILLPDSPPDWRDRTTQVIRFDVSSATNLVQYFDDWDRMVQARCFVRGAEDGRSYRGFAVGPLQEGIDISMRGTRREEAVRIEPDAAGKYWYTLYAFLDLTADDEKYVDGKPRGVLDLSSQEFSSVGCFVIGVTKAPVLFPRTNAVYASERELKEAISHLARGNAG